MSYIGNKPESYAGKVVGNGQCVAFVRDCASAPSSTTWSRGALVKTTNVPQHTAIATFNDDGDYPTNPTGQHAAIFISKEADGIWVWDQWSGQPVHKRFIRYKNGAGSWSNDADRFSVIEGSKFTQMVVDKSRDEPPVCVSLGLLPHGAYGGYALQLPAPTFVAEASTYDYSHKPVVTRLESVLADGLPVSGLGHFWSLELALRPWSGFISEIELQLVSYAGAETQCRVSDADGNVISDVLHPTPQKHLSTVAVSGSGISKVEFPQSPELTLVRLCVKTIP